jgi:hypothetical protein
VLILLKALADIIIKKIKISVSIAEDQSLKQKVGLKKQKQEI